MEPTTLSPTHYFPARPRPAAPRSPSRSPSRRQYFTKQELNPLLSDLSPSSTLEALQANDLARTGGKAGKNFIQESGASASTSERAWGIKAALAGKKVRQWYAEVEGWAWPGFDQPPSEESTKTWAQHHPESHIDRGFSLDAVGISGGNPTRKQTIGTLSPKLIQKYEERIETIRDDMETLEIEDLKDYVRNTHFKAGSRRSSLNDPEASFEFATDYDRLDDFTAIITATIVQALPTISRLETLLNTWSTRLLVIRQVPSFLSDLYAGRESMVSATIAIGAHNVQHTKRRSEFSQKAFSDIRAVLQDQIAELGRKLDRMLDLLEGSADTLPDAWIDGLDDMENQYSAWVVKAERLAMNKELKNRRLEKDFTQEDPDKILDLSKALDIRHTTSTLDIGAQFDEIRRRADSDFHLIQPNPMETANPETSATGSSTESSAGTFDLEPSSSRGALPEQRLGTEAHSRGPIVNGVEMQLSDGLPDGLQAPSLPERSSHRPSPEIVVGSKTKAKRPGSGDAASDTSDSRSSTSNYSVNKPSPEIRSAVVAEYIGSPVRVTSPTLLDIESMTSRDIPFRRPGQRAEGDGAKTHQSGLPLDLAAKSRRHKRGSGHVKTRSASLQSFEIVPKHEIRRIQVTRSGSYSSAFSLSDLEYGQVQPSRLPSNSAPPPGESGASVTRTPLQAFEKLNDQQSSAPAQNWNPGLERPKQQPLYHPPPPVSVQSSVSAQSSDRNIHTPKQQLPYRSPPAVPPRAAHSAQSLDAKLNTAEHRVSYHSPPPVPPRATHRFEQVSDLGPGSTPVKVRQMKMSDPTSGHAAGYVETARTTLDLSPSSFDDQLEERISSILTELPTQIRLTSGPESDAPEVTRFNSPSDPRTPKIRSPAWRLKGAQTSTTLPSMTLAPAQPKSSNPRSLTGQPDIKLYHLHQNGKSAPIKLFVRLVGEGGERVMVRIGGGWADLGEYLREYAGHHGRRSVSETPFDITGLPSSSPPTNNQSPRSRPGSRPASPTSSMKQTPAANRLAMQQTPSAISDGPNTPQSDPSSRSSQRLSWTGTDEVSPSLGLAGPKTKNVEISPRKQAWVDEIMEKARHSGAEKKGGSESVVGDLGKVGSTRRVFFRSKKEGQGHSQPSKERNLHS